MWKVIEIKSSVCFVLFVLSVLCILILAYGLYGQGTGLFASIFSLVRGIRVFVPKTIPYLWTFLYGMCIVASWQSRRFARMDLRAESRSGTRERTRKSQDRKRAIETMKNKPKRQESNWGRSKIAWNWTK